MKRKHIKILNRPLPTIIYTDVGSFIRHSDFVSYIGVLKENDNQYRQQLYLCVNELVDVDNKKNQKVLDKIREIADSIKYQHIKNESMQYNIGGNK